MGETSRRRICGYKLAFLGFCVIASAAFARAASDPHDQSNDHTDGEAVLAEESPVYYDKSLEASSAYKEAMQTLHSLSPPSKPDTPWNPNQNSRSFLSYIFPNPQGPIASAIRIIYKLKSHNWIPRWLSGKFEGVDQNQNSKWGIFRSSSKGVASGKVLKVIDLLQHSADLGNMDAVFTLGRISLFPPSPLPANASRAFHAFLKHSHATGNAASQAYVAFFYSTGYENVVPVDQAKALLYYTFAAHGGNEDAEMALGYRNWAGIGIKEDCMVALEWYEAAAESAMAHFLSGPAGGRTLPRTFTRISDLQGGVYGPGASVASTGPNVHRPAIKASKSKGTGETWEDLLEFYQFHADREEPEYALHLGRIYYQGGIYQAPGGIASGTEGVGALSRDFARARHYFLQVARQVWLPPVKGSNKKDAHLRKKENLDDHTLVSASIAAAYLGRMYLRGEGVKYDPQSAKMWFERGAEFGDKECHNGLGIIWRDGLVNRKIDEKVANECFFAAASQDLAEAQVNLGKFHYNHRELPLALKYFEAAIRHGSPFEAFYYIASIHAKRAQDRNSIPSLRAGSCGVAVSFFKLVAERGSWKNTLMSEAESLWLRGGDADKEAARLRWWMAAEQGFEVGQSNLAYVLDQHKSFLQLPNSRKPENNTARLALVQWTRSAAQHDVDALVKVGDYYYHGLGVNDESEELRWEKAAGYYLSAVETQRSALAMWNLGWMYENGKGVNQDFHLAKRYYDMALETNSEAYLPVVLSVVKLYTRSLWHTLAGGRDKGLILWGKDNTEDDHWYLGKAREEFAKRWRGRRIPNGNNNRESLEADDPVQWAKDKKEADIERARAEEEAFERGDFFSGDFLATGDPRPRRHEDAAEEFWETMFLVLICVMISCLIYVRGRYVARAEAERRRIARQNAEAAGVPAVGGTAHQRAQAMVERRLEEQRREREQVQERQPVFPHPVEPSPPTGLFEPGEEPPDY
ncbi:uncharacterized protein EI90DRAFT_3146653 [Cantharellus anzutake]|uniref:uncharacterized protein n=1 Tax=Cantharellus anzutake TaxID=1750568 RepID=UPI001902C9A4|nr:uncharacterized protein EI90DRAFT_3146653 [Cantharellus anzutake]KAF8325879.1 hypothetical protein EI90DRAFT_3146653 [Cantharellus anzutake]